MSESNNLRNDLAVLPCFVGETADEIWRSAAEALIDRAEVPRRDSRLGMTRELLHCSFLLKNPRQRWVLSRRPAINPAFAVAEVIWILSGRDDAGFPTHWNPALPRFAGRGEHFHGAYGHRLRRNLSFDQVERAWRALSANPDSRQVVLQIWDGQLDFPNPDGSARDPDIPCNVCSMPKIRDGRLEWLQIVRSNDLFLGTPHNFVQFTVLQEVIAGWLGLELGNYVQVSDSLHLYEKDLSSMSVGAVRPLVYPEDRLALPKAEFDEVLRSLGVGMDRLRLDTLTPTAFLHLIEAVSVPESWANLFRIAAADAARRRGWEEESEAAADACTSPCLSTAWKSWVERVRAP